MSTITVVYIVTAAISIVIAFLLVYLTDLSARARDDAARQLASPDGQSFRQAVLKEVSDVSERRGRPEEVAEAVSALFTRELDKKVEQTTQKLGVEYGKIIQEKVESEQAAWKKYKRVASDKKQTESVIRSIAEGVVVVNPKGEIMMMNPAAERLLGASKNDKVGKPLLANLKEEQLVSITRGGRDEENREIELVSSQDDTKRTIRASSAVIEDEDGQTVGMVSMLSDITKQKELDRMKAQFVANVSHELRTPLIAVQKSVALILTQATGPVAAAQEQLLVIAERNLKRLTALINDLLDLAKLEAGKMEIKKAPSSIARVIEETVQALETWADSKGLKLEREVHDALPEVGLDADRITQVLTNLIGNAVKFTPRDGTITVGARPAADGSAIEVSVRDTGIGIAPEDLPKIFDKFYQTGELVKSDISGTGIGLSIAKEIVERHGGAIRVESEKGRGTEFIFSIPV